MKKIKFEVKIVCIESADPGYDWILAHEPAGILTKFGGANSHMAIRSAELGIPACIGCGRVSYERALKAKIIEIDCINQKRYFSNA